MCHTHTSCNYQLTYHVCNTCKHDIDHAVSPPARFRTSIDDTVGIVLELQRRHQRGSERNTCRALLTRLLPCLGSMTVLYSSVSRSVHVYESQGLGPLTVYGKAGGFPRVLVNRSGDHATLASRIIQAWGQTMFHQFWSLIQVCSVWSSILVYSYGLLVSSVLLYRFDQCLCIPSSRAINNFQFQ